MTRYHLYMCADSISFYEYFVCVIYQCRHGHRSIFLVFCLNFSVCVCGVFVDLHMYIYTFAKVHIHTCINV